MHGSPVRVDTDTPVAAGISLGDLWRIACQAKWMILGITGAATIAAATSVSMMPNQYSVSTMIDPGKGGDKTGYQLATVINSPDAAQKVVTALSLQAALRSTDEQAAVRALQAMAGASFDKRSGLLKISVTYSDSNLAAQIVNEYAVYAKAYASAVLLTEESRLLLELNKRLQQSKTAIANIEKEIEKSKITLAGDTRFVAMAIGDLRAEMAFTDPTDARQSTFLLQENLAKLVNALNKTSVVATKKQPNFKVEEFDSAELYSTLRNVIDLEFHLSLVRKLIFQINLLRELEGIAIRQLNPVTIPRDPSSPRRLRIVANAFGASLALALLLAFVIDRRRMVQS